MTPSSRRAGGDGAARARSGTSWGLAEWLVHERAVRHPGPAVGGALGEKSELAVRLRCDGDAGLHRLSAVASLALDPERAPTETPALGLVAPAAVEAVVRDDVLLGQVSEEAHALRHAAVPALRLRVADDHEAALVPVAGLAVTILPAFDRPRADEHLQLVVPRWARHRGRLRRRGRGRLVLRQHRRRRSEDQGG